MLLFLIFNNLFAKCYLLPFRNGLVVEARWSEAHFSRFCHIAIFRNGLCSSVNCGTLSNISSELKCEISSIQVFISWFWFVDQMKDWSHSYLRLFLGGNLVLCTEGTIKSKLEHSNIFILTGCHGRIYFWLSLPKNIYCKFLSLSVPFLSSLAHDCYW